MNIIYIHKPASAKNLKIKQQKFKNSFKNSTIFFYKIVKSYKMLKKPKKATTLAALHSTLSKTMETIFVTFIICANTF